MTKFDYKTKEGRKEIYLALIVAIDEGHIFCCCSMIGNLVFECEYYFEYNRIDKICPEVYAQKPKCTRIHEEWFSSMGERRLALLKAISLCEQ